MSSTPPNHVFWLYGLSGAGKSTLARQVAERLLAGGCRAVVLDGDDLRLGLCRDLGFGPEDRQENVRRAAEVSRLLSRQGLVVLSALMTPLEDMRRLARSIIGDDLFHEVYLRCDYATCAERDPKGLYARAETGGMRHFPGRDMVFEEPRLPDLVLETGCCCIEECVAALLASIDGKICPATGGDTPVHEPERSHGLQEAAAAPASCHTLICQSAA